MKTALHLFGQQVARRWNIGTSDTEAIRRMYERLQPSDLTRDERKEVYEGVLYELRNNRSIFVANRF